MSDTERLDVKVTLMTATRRELDRPDDVARLDCELSNGDAFSWTLPSSLVDAVIADHNRAKATGDLVKALEAAADGLAHAVMFYAGVYSSRGMSVKQTEADPAFKRVVKAKNAVEAALAALWLDDFEVVTAVYVTKLESQLSVLQERLREAEAERDRLKICEESMMLYWRAWSAQADRANTAESKLTTANARNLDLQAQVVARIQERDTAERVLGALLTENTTRNNGRDPYPGWLAYMDDFGCYCTFCGKSGGNPHDVADVAIWPHCDNCPVKVGLKALESARQPAAGQDNANEEA